ncbi:MAG: hypothetical protein FWG42_12630, partial [Clostridiales bacterium]|nr:hypothetical protein [Clostridiales bacterium]
MKRKISALLVLALALSLMPAFSLNAAAADPFEQLLFENSATKVFTERTLVATAQFPAVVYDTWEVGCYMLTPATGWTNALNYARMYIHVPVSIDGAAVTGEALAKAPMMLQVNWGGDSATAPSSAFPSGNNHREAISRGWVVVNPGMYGNNCTATIDGTYYNYGKFPYNMANLKSAVRYLRYGTNETVIPGDKEKIFATGSSSGGCGSLMLAASGNSPLYDIGLELFGAAPGRDDIAGCLSSCPITPRDNSEDAYAWQRLFGQDLDAVDTTGLTAAQAKNLRINKAFVEGYKLYQPALGLEAAFDFNTVKKGDLLTPGNVLEYYHYYYMRSADAYFSAQTPAQIDTYLNGTRGSGANQVRRSDIFDMERDADGSYVTLNGGWYANWKNHMKYTFAAATFSGQTPNINPLACDYLYDGSFTNETILDNGIMPYPAPGGSVSALANSTFGKINDRVCTFSTTGLKWIRDPANFSNGVARSVSQDYLDWYDLQCKSSDPVYFIMNKDSIKVDVGRYFFIRTGLVDSVAMPVTFLNTVTALENQGIEVNGGLTWDGGHGTMPNTAFAEFFEWVTELMDETVYPSINIDEESDIDKDVNLYMSLRNAINVLNVEAEILVDGRMLSGIDIVGLNGFDTIDGTLWAYAGDGMWKGTFTLGYPAGSSEGLTSKEPVDIAKIVFAPRALGDTVLTLASAKAVGLRDGATCYLDTVVENGQAMTNIDQRAFSKYDLNRDNKVDALDLGIMLLY